MPPIRQQRKSRGQLHVRLVTLHHERVAWNPAEAESRGLGKGEEKLARGQSVSVRQEIKAQETYTLN